MHAYIQVFEQKEQQSLGNAAESYFARIEH